MGKKNKLTCLVLLILVVTLCALAIVDNFVNKQNKNSPIEIQGAQANLSDKDNITNNANVGSVNTEIIEDFAPPEELMPGIDFTKNVSVKNVGPSACFIRIKAVFTDSDMEKLCSVLWNTTDFEYNTQDGFWYYKSVLHNGETTSSLFQKVSILTEMEDGTPITKDMMKDFDILVYMESYQAECNDNSYELDENGYFANYQDAWDKYQTNNPTNK
jgi:hypothetical protein